MFDASTLPQFHTSTPPHFHTSTLQHSPLPHLHISTLPHFPTSTCPHFHTSILPHFNTSTLQHSTPLDFHTSTLPHLHTSALHPSTSTDMACGSITPLSIAARSSTGLFRRQATLPRAPFHFPQTIDRSVSATTLPLAPFHFPRHGRRGMWKLSRLCRWPHGHRHVVSATGHTPTCALPLPQTWLVSRFAVLLFFYLGMWPVAETNLSMTARLSTKA